jgi:hypothetical protein
MSPTGLIIELNRLDHEAAIASQARNVPELRKVRAKMKLLLERHYRTPARSDSARA